MAKTPSSTLRCWAGIFRSRLFKHFTTTHLSIDTKPPVDDNFDINAPSAETYICGSDQIWNTNYLRNSKYEQLFFLDFGSHDVLRIAYAASLGTSIIPDAWTARFREYLSRFDKISTREKEAVELLQPLTDKPVFWVPDPTMLLKDRDYRTGLNLPEQQLNQIFSYTLDKQISPLIEQTRRRVQLTLGIPLVESYERNPLKVIFKGVLSPVEWLSSLASSKFVLTNSFHGTVFAIIFKRPFIVLPLEGKNVGMNSRLTSLLEYVGLEDHILATFDQERVDALCKTKIDWRTTEVKLNEFSSIGKTFLREALNMKSTDCN